MKVTLIPYKGYSKSGQRLKELNPDWDYNTRQGDIFINFGSTTKLRSGTICLNHPSKVKTSINKLSCFKALEGVVPIPRYTTDPSVASTFTRPIYERTLLNSSQGRGIIVNLSPSINRAKLYVEGVPIKREYRVIAVANQPIAIMMKVPRHDKNPNMFIRNLSKGWRFSTNTVYPLEQAKVKETALKAIKALGLQFGAVDLVVAPSKEVYVLEVNTAFALGRRNAQAFSTSINNYISHLKESLWNISSQSMDHSNEDTETTPSCQELQDNTSQTQSVQMTTTS